MVAQVVIDQPQGNGVIALVRRDDAAILGHVRELDGGAWHGAPAGQPARAFRSREAAERWVLSIATAPGPWERALARAIAEGIDPLEVAGMDGVFFCESGTEPGRGYLASADSCTCKAGDRGMACKHVAAVRACLGLPVAPDPEPEPETPAPAACPYCEGTPVWGNNICRPCLGSGRRDRLTPAALAAWEEVQARRRPAA